MLSGRRQQQDSGQAGEGRPDPGHTQGDPEASAVSDEVPRWAVAKGQRAGPRVLRCQRLLTAGGTRVKMGGHPGHPAPLSVPSSPHLALLLGVPGVGFVAICECAPPGQQTSGNRAGPACHEADWREGPAGGREGEKGEAGCWGRRRGERKTGVGEKP